MGTLNKCLFVTLCRIKFQSKMHFRLCGPFLLSSVDSLTIVSRTKSLKETGDLDLIQLALN